MAREAGVRRSADYPDKPRVMCPECDNETHVIKFQMGYAKEGEYGWVGKPAYGCHVMNPNAKPKNRIKCPLAQTPIHKAEKTEV